MTKSLTKSFSASIRDSSMALGFAAIVSQVVRVGANTEVRGARERLSDGQPVRHAAVHAGAFPRLHSAG